ncbi:L,D-transpeptidase family protein [Sulfitobacter donghicola]|nr:L,D-transpeptidase family protein [Sulfitobacter donghicola]
MADPSLQATRVMVDKSERILTLLRDGEPILSVPVSLGAQPEGHKTQEGDERTPTGTYVIDWRNPNSIAHLSLHISYPNEVDAQNATTRGVSPGGNIMIHGIANGWGFLGKLHRYWDWTNGCIAVTNTEMKTIWSFVPNGTPIEITE